MGCDLPQSSCSRHHVYVCLSLTFSFIDLKPDYYYYATAGGAKIWVRDFLKPYDTLIMDLDNSGKST